MVTFLASRRYMSGEQFDALGRAYTHTQLEALRRSDAFVGWCASHALCNLLSPSIRPSSRPAADSQWPVALAPPAYLSCLYSASVICVLCSAPPLRYGMAWHGMAGCAAGQLSMAVLPPLTMTTTKMTTTMTMMVARVCAVNEAAITVPGGAHPPSAARGPAGLPSEIHLCPRLACFVV
jgi:hypothetical protein